MIKLLIRTIKLLLLVAALAVLGFIVGLMVVLLPPLAWIGVIAIALVVLLWVMPELPLVNPRHVEILFYVAFASQIIFPAYYAFAAPGLPWISLRRLAWFPLIFAAGLLVSSSAEARGKIVANFAASKAVSIPAVIFLVCQFLSVFTSINFSESLKDVWNAIIYWYVALFCAVVFISDERKSLMVFRILCWVCIVAGLMGLAEFVSQSRFIARLWPEVFIQQLFATNPEVFENIVRPTMRGGSFRSNFIYNVSLSYGEFLSTSIPVCVYVALQNRTMTERLVGVVATIACVAGIYVSGSRGAILGAAVATPLTIVLWIIRTQKHRPGSMIAPIAAVTLAIGFAGFIALFAASNRFSQGFTGGAEAAGSNTARLDQWTLAVPKILMNPITGHGAGLGAEIVGYAPFGNLTVDSYVISLLVEIGVPGFIAFFAMVWGCAYLLMRIGITRTETMFEYAIPLCGALTSFGIYRLVLSQRENHILLFVLVGMAIVQIAAARRAEQTSRETSQRRRHPVSVPA